MSENYKIQYAKKEQEYAYYLTTKVYAKASIETQRRTLEKYSLVMPSTTPSWVTNTDTLECLKSLDK